MPTFAHHARQARAWLRRCPITWVIAFGLAVGLSFAISACKPAPEATDAGPPWLVAFYKAGPEAENEPPIGRITVEAYLQREARLRITREDSLNAEALNPELRTALLEDMIEAFLLHHEAEKRGLSDTRVSAEVELYGMKATIPKREYARLLSSTYQSDADLLSVLEEDLAVVRLMESELLPKAHPSDAELQAAFDALSDDDRRRPARVHAEQIVVKSSKNARRIYRLLKRGSDFAEMAKKESVSLEGRDGGDLGWFAKSEMPAVFSKTCFALKPGELSEPIASSHGFHIFRVVDRQDARAYTFEELKPRLREALTTQRFRETKEAFLQGLQRETRVDLNRANLARIGINDL